MSYQQWPATDGDFMIDWSTIYKLIRSHECAKAQLDNFRTVNIVQSDWYNPFSWSMPDIEIIDINWDIVRENINRNTIIEYNRMTEACATSGVRKEAESLLIKIRRTKVLKNNFLVLMRDNQITNANHRQRAIKDYDSHIETAKFARNTSATGLMVGATFLSGGTAAAIIASGSSLKGYGKYQDTGNIGVAMMEFGGTLVFSLIPAKGPKGETLMAIVEASWETGMGLVEGKAFTEALASGAFKLTGPLTDKLFASKELTNMLSRVVIPIKPSVGISLTTLGTNYSSTLAGKMLQGKFEKNGGDIAKEYFGKKHTQQPPMTKAKSMIDKVILDDEYLLKAAIVNMKLGIGRGW